MGWGGWGGTGVPGLAPEMVIEATILLAALQLLCDRTSTPYKTEECSKYQKTRIAAL